MSGEFLSTICRRASTQKDSMARVPSIIGTWIGPLVLRSRSQRVSLIVIPFCLSVCLDVCQSFRDLQPTTVDRSQPNLVGRSLSSDPCKPFWIPYLPYFRCQREICKISPIAYSCDCERDASCHMTCFELSLIQFLPA